MKKHQAHHDFELNLTPIIDCFVTLICFLLLSATYVNLVGLDSKVPITVLSSSEQAQTQAKKKEPFKLDLKVKANGMELVASGAGKASGKRWIPLLKEAPKAGESRQDLVTLHNELVKVKREATKEFSINFTSETNMRYEELVRFMDVTRNLQPQDGEFLVTDERNGQQVKMDVLFPDFVMSNLTPTLADAKAGNRAGR